MTVTRRDRSRSPRRHDLRRASPVLFTEVTGKIGEMLPDQEMVRLSLASSEIMRPLANRLKEICRPVICLKRDTSFLRHEENCYTEGGRIHLNLLRECQPRSAEFLETEDQKVLFLFEFTKSFLKLLLRSASLCSTRRSTEEHIDLDETRTADRMENPDRLHVGVGRYGDSCSIMISLAVDRSMSYSYDGRSDGSSTYFRLKTPDGSYDYSVFNRRERSLNVKSPQVLNVLLSDTKKIMGAPIDATLKYENIRSNITYQERDVILRFSNFRQSMTETENAR